MIESSENERAMLKLVAVNAQIDGISMDLKRELEESHRRGMELVSRSQQINDRESSESIEIDEKIREAFAREEWQVHFLRKASALEFEYKNLYLELRKSMKKNVFGASRRKKLLALVAPAESQLEVFIDEIRHVFMGDFVDVTGYPEFKVFCVDSFSMNEGSEIREAALKLASKRLAARSLARGDHKLKGWKKMFGN